MFGSSTNATQRTLPWTHLFRIRETWGLVTAKFLSDAARFFYLFWLRKYLCDACGFDTKLGEAGVLNRDAFTVNGQPIWKNVSKAPCWNREVIRPVTEPFKASAGIAVLRGNLAPDDAVIKPSAAMGIRA